MRVLIERLRREPAIIGSFVAALVGIAAAFGLDLDVEQTSAITAGVTLVIGWLIRAQVTPATPRPDDVEAEDFTDIAAKAVDEAGNIIDEVDD